MSVNEDWDVEQHKVEYESDEHWELRRKFLLAHKDKFPENVLVCLAQVFVNVELLGCRYPQETMDLVKELSEDIAGEYREKQKKKLQRTFVEASEAASSKVKGCTAKISTVTEEPIPNTSDHISNTSNHTLNIASHVSNIDNHNDKTCKKRHSKKNKKLEAKKTLVPNIMNKLVSSGVISLNCQSYENPDIEESPPKRLRTEESVSFKDQDHPFRDIVLWERPGDNVLNLLEMSAAISGVTLKWSYSKIETGCTACSLLNTDLRATLSKLATLINIKLNQIQYIQYVYTADSLLIGMLFNLDSQKVCRTTNFYKKQARKEAAIIALEKLRKCCYTVKVKILDAKSKVTVTTEEIKSQKSDSDDDWKESNCIGKKLMTMMGWAGGGLGKSEQGIMEPMSALVKTQINREGLGLKTNSYNAHEIKAKCRRLFKDLLQTDDYLQHDVVFLDFPKEDRMIIHQIARIMGLKSRSHGKDNRKLIVSRKVDIWTLVKKLNNLGGVTDKYELVKPADERFVSLPTSTKI